jgi:hypothetical protein
MSDAEPGSQFGEFYHLGTKHQTRALRCLNAGKAFDTRDQELVPFMRKARRRVLKRFGIRA